MALPILTDNGRLVVRKLNRERGRKNNYYLKKKNRKRKKL